MHVKKANLMKQQQNELRKTEDELRKVSKFNFQFTNTIEGHKINIKLKQHKHKNSRKKCQFRKVYENRYKKTYKSNPCG